MALLGTILAAADEWRFPLSIALSIVTPFLVTWLLTSWRAGRALTAAARTAPGEKRPPGLPSAVPLLGHLIDFIYDGPRLFACAARRFGKGIPARLDLATFSAYAVSDPALVSAVLRDPTHDLRSPLHDIEFLKPAYNYPQELLDKLKHPEAAAAWKQRYHGVAGMMNGHWVEALAEKFHESATCWVRDERARIGDGWTELPDLCALVERLVVEAATCAMFGAKMLELNPTLADDARAFTHHAPTLFSGLPAWANRPAVRARDRMKANLVRWQRQAREHGAIDTILDDVAWEPWHGSKTFRTLQRTLTDQGILDDEARAAENLGALFGANGQPPYLATWYLIETLIDPTLKARVLKRVRIARRPPAGISAWPTVLDRAQLEDDALLQSVYAETLRLHQAMVIFRFLSGDAYSLQGWRINRGESVAVSTRTAHLNPDVWNAGTPDDPHAVDRFWADRFIVHPDDPYSGPLKKQDHRSAAKSASRSSTKGSSEKEPYFSLQGCHNSFLAFGGGRGMCPGRHFAKRVIMLTTAILLNAYDIELLTDKLPAEDGKHFGMGPLPPKSKVPCRIRRRVRS